MADLSEAERARRRPVWDALSDLFLDTETRPSVCRAANACFESGYPVETLDHIWRHEVAPVLAPNLLSVAGEWASFDIEWLEDQICHRRAGLLDGMKAKVNQDHWRQVKRLSAWLGALTPDQRHRVTPALPTMVWMALGPSFGRSLARYDLSAADARLAWTEAIVPLLTAIHYPKADGPLDAIITRGKAKFSPEIPVNPLI